MAKRNVEIGQNESLTIRPGTQIPDEQIANIVQRKRGSKSAAIEANTSARPEEISRAISNAFQYFNRDIVQSDEECAERLNQYFSECTANSALPTVEHMSLALGTTRKTVWDWENGRGCSTARSYMIKKAKQILAAIDAELVSSGKIPQVVYIFRAKNFFGMSDQTEVVLTPNNPLGETIDAEEIIKKYQELPED